MPPLVPPLLARRSSDEYWPAVWRRADRVALSRLRQVAVRRGPRLGLSPELYLRHDRRGTAATLRAIDQAHGGGFYDIPAEAEIDEAAADLAFNGQPGAPVVDVQTHLVNPARWQSPLGEAMLAFLQATDPDRWSEGVDPHRLAAPAWATHVFGESETSVALLTSTPGREEENILTNTEIAAAAEIADRYAGSGRVLTHTIVHPNLGPAELERMEGWRDELTPAGWKAYTLWDPPELLAGGGPARGWFLDDEEVGIPFLERVRELGPRVVAVHKGIGGPIPGHAPAGASPRDIGPAAVRFPDLTFLVYHSGYEPDPHGEEGAYPGDDRAFSEASELTGVDRLVASVRASGIGPGANVYAELGSTWFMMIRRPHEAAHVLGKLLATLGEERIVWGTDCIWYGSPQPLIDAFRAFTIPEWMRERYGYPELTREAKTKILGLNACSAYTIEPATAAGFVDAPSGWVADASRDLGQRLIGG